MAYTVGQDIDRSVEVTPGRTVFTIVYKVYTDQLDSDPFDAAAAVGISIGDFYKSTNCKCVSVVGNNSESDDGCTYKVTVIYDNQESFNSVENPLAQPWEREWDAHFEDEIIEQDATGKPVLNVVGDPYRDPLTRDKPISVLSVTGNSATYSEGLAASYRGKCNSDGYMGWAPGYVKCLAIKASLQYDQNIGEYWKVTYQLGFNSDGWDKWVLEMGYNELKYNEETEKLEKTRIKLDDDEYPSDPVLLTRDGKQAEKGANPVFTFYQPNERLPFNGVFN